MIIRGDPLKLTGIFILLCLNMTAAGAFITGKVICAQSGLPLDGVRVASVAGKNSTTTDIDGHFLLATASMPESTVVSSCYEYSMNFLSSGKRETIIADEIKSLTFSLFDLKGQLVEHTVCQNAVLRFPQKKLSSGTYLLQVTGFKPERILITGSSRQGIVYKWRPPEIVFSKPDTIYFCKDGYRPHSASRSAIKNDQPIALRKKSWVASDIHNHTVLTDGAYIQDSLLLHAFGEGGLEVYANSEHGGMNSVDTAGLPVTGDAVPRGYDGASVPRWYTLTNYSWPKLLGQRTLYPGKIIIQGVEWNCPGHEHASVGFVGDVSQPDAIAKFEYQFDAVDYDTSISWLRKRNANEHSNAIGALSWMQANYSGSSYCFINHPSCLSAEMYSISDIRDFHNLAPTVCLGFEGMPGHQRKYIRGNYSYSTPESSTWGGADYKIARVGGVWDALLGEGRHFWIIANSDFHLTSNDFWPGEYAKTWSTVTDTGAQAWLDGMRTGEIVIATGDLVSRLEFSIDDGIHDAPMGADLFCRSREPTVIIRFKETPVNNHGDTNHIDHIDLIAGRITGKKDPSNLVSYAEETNPATTCIRRFSPSDWMMDNGWKVIRATIPCTQPMFYRLRGTNLAVGEPGEADEEGNPLMDQAGANNEEIAWNDLWFYSNPIFVYPSW
jgi:hypothetical protein